MLTEKKYFRDGGRFSPTKPLQYSPVFNIMLKRNGSEMVVDCGWNKLCELGIGNE